MSKKILLMIVTLVIALAALLWAARSEGTGRPIFSQSSLVITRADGTVFSFSVEVAQTPEEQAYGLMFIHSLADDKGMIFPYDPPREIAFWMKNTLIPLDMLFIRPDGTIGRIVAEAQPEDLTPIQSQMPVSAVIEIRGGLAKQDGLSVGDKIDSPVIVTPR